MALLAAPILFIAAVLYIAYPLLREGDGEPISGADAGREKTFLEKEEVIEILRDIEMDYRMGKLSSEDYQVLKRDFEQRAVGALQRYQKAGGKIRAAGDSDSA